MAMTLRELIERLQEIEEEGVATPDSPIMVEKTNDEGELYQGDVECVDAEFRCEEDDEPCSVYLNLGKVSW